MAAGATMRALPSAACTSTWARPYRVAGIAVFAIAADVAIDPTHTHVPLCPLHAMTGLSCPVCGSLRAVNELARGHVGTALRDNALLVLAVPVVLALWWAWVVRAGASRRAPRWSRAAAVGFVLLLATFGVVRNLPFATALRPGS